MARGRGADDRDPFGAVHRARAEFEARQDGVQEARESYYEAVTQLHQQGMPLREIAQSLGVSHQRVHQMVSETKKAARKSRQHSTARVGVAALLLLATVSAVSVGIDRLHLTDKATVGTVAPELPELEKDGEMRARPRSVRLRMEAIEDSIESTNRAVLRDLRSKRRRDR